MATVEYDLSLSGGLMEQIQALTAPPASDHGHRRQRVRERAGGYRRHGKLVNHDCCDSCKEGGDLICCDRCPAAFHLQCHDPPLSDDSLPTGEWMCHRCKMNPPPEPKEDDSSSTCSTYSKYSTNSRTGSHRGAGYIEEIEWEDLLAEQEAEEEFVSNTPLAMLVKAAMMSNPRQMALPKDLACHVQLPGSSKRRYPFREVGRPSSKKPAHELDNGVVPLPAKLCYGCGKSCRIGPLIQCDFCPLLFHMDCLDPPLTSPPLTRWMCPNHAEHGIDQTLVKSTKLTERLKLWNKYAGPVNQHSVKIQFLNKIHRKNPPFRIKEKHVRKNTVKVPAAIKAHYADPPSVLSGLSQAQVEAAQQNVNLGHYEATAEEQEEWLSAVVNLQTSIARHLAQKQLVPDVKTEPADTFPGTSNISMSSVKTGSKPTASVLPTVKHGLSEADTAKVVINGSLPSTTSSSQDSSDLKGMKSKLNSGGSPVFSNGDVLDTSSEKSNSPSAVLRLDLYSDESCRKTDSSVTEEDLKFSQSKNNVSSGKNSLTAMAACNKVHGSSTGKSGLGHSSSRVSSSSDSPEINSKTVPVSSGKSGPISSTSSSSSSSSSKLNTLSAASQVNWSTVSTMQSRGITNSNVISSPAIVNLSNALQSVVEGNAEPDLHKLDERLVQVLAWQRLQQLLSNSKPANNPPIYSVNSSSSTPSSKSASGASLQGDLRARALLCPLSSRGQPVPMTYRKLTIGTGGDMDVCLTGFGNCSFVSAKHACIFYDEATRHYELLNYSEHGTTVDNVLYSCDFSEKAVTSSQPSNIVSSVRKIINKTQKKEKEVTPTEERETMAAHAYVQRRTCCCKASSSSLIGGSGAGWEGTAILHHGSYIKLGCLQFVFSIVDQALSGSNERKLSAASLLKATLKSPRHAP